MCLFVPTVCSYLTFLHFHPLLYFLAIVFDFLLNVYSNMFFMIYGTFLELEAQQCTIPYLYNPLPPIRPTAYSHIDIFWFFVARLEVPVRP